MIQLKPIPTVKSIGRKGGSRFFGNPMRQNRNRDHRTVQINRPMILSSEIS